MDSGIWKKHIISTLRNLGYNQVIDLPIERDVNMCEPEERTFKLTFVKSIAIIMLFMSITQIK
jgi:hypothetical protein